MNMKTKIYRKNNITTYVFQSGNMSFKVTIDANNELTWKFKGKFPYTLEAVRFVLTNESGLRHTIFVFIPFNAEYIKNIMEKSGFHEVKGHYGSVKQLWQAELI